jgi:imidazole glycerol phosphate synthase glutamine amidotransferase subunit
MITIADYGMGNLRNVRRGFEGAGCDVRVTNDPAEVFTAEVLVLPGVGAFGEAVRRIDRLGLRKPILHVVESGRPMLGICLGMQLLYEWSEESPGEKGLGLLKGTIVRFTQGLKVPHIGWNDVTPTRASPLFPGSGGVFYFVHSYHAALGEETIATTDYGKVFSSAVMREQVFGVQFHPEKSHAVGLALLRSFIESAIGKASTESR